MSKEEAPISDRFSSQALGPDSLHAGPPDLALVVQDSSVFGEMERAIV